MTLEQIEEFLINLSQLGPFPGILAPFLEAFLPFLPLILIIAANVNIYGFWFGVLFSWIGVIGGSAALFGILRKYGHKLSVHLEKKFPTMHKIFSWIEHRGFTPILLLSCFPFTPSVIITVVAGMSKLPFGTYFLAIALGKAVMILFVALLSFDFTQLIHEPWRIIVTLLGIVLLWYVGKRLEKKFINK